MLTANATLPNELHQSLLNARKQYDDIINNANATSVLSSEDENLDKLGEITDKLNAEKGA